jgi:tetratricopeptide (TPR) repeat protein
MTAACAIFAATLICQAPPSASPSTDTIAEAYFLFLQSRRLEQTGNVEGAVSALRRAAALMPRTAEIQAELCAVYAREGRVADAFAAGDAALAIDGSNREAHRTLGLLKAAAADTPAYASSAVAFRAQAVTHLEQALSVPMSDPQAQFVLATLYVQAKQHEKAIAVLKKFLAEQPGYPQALLMLGESAESANRWEEAAAAWGQISQMGPAGRAYRSRFASALVKLGDYYFELKRYREAADTFDRALGSDRAAFDATEVTRKRDRARELAGK